MAQEAKVYLEPWYGWKSLSVIGDYLYSSTYMTRWPKGEALLAEHVVDIRSMEHAGESCWCGINAYALDTLHGVEFAARIHLPRITVLTRVALWGEVRIFQGGARGEYGAINAIYGFEGCKCIYCLSALHISLLYNVPLVSPNGVTIFELDASLVRRFNRKAAGLTALSTIGILISGLGMWSLIIGMSSDLHVGPDFAGFLGLVSMIILLAVSTLILSKNIDEVYPEVGESQRTELHR
jgi:hypothetical protein